MKRFVVPIVLLALAACSQTPVPGEAGGVPLTTTSLKTYTTSSETIANPERGFYLHPGNCSQTATSSGPGRTTPFSSSMFNLYKTGDKKMTLILCIFYLPKESNISGALTFFKKQVDAVEAAGFKMILRFAYTEGSDDVPVARVKEHLAQIKPFLQDNSHVIAVLESGFVGAYGEGYSTQNFGDKGVVSTQNWLDRKAIVDELMTILPSRMVSVRTIRMKRNMYFPTPETARVNPVPVSSSDAYGTKDVAQVGYYNDCFLNGVHDSDTYRRPLNVHGNNDWNIPKEDYPEQTKNYLEADKAYLALDTKHVVMGGETCDIANGDQWKGPNAVSEMQRFHFSYLNGVRRKEILDSWEASGHMTSVKQNLGYRFSLISSDFPTSVTRGSTFLAQVNIRNTGWAAPFNRRSAYLVLRNTVTKAVFKMSFSTDARQWQPGTSVRLAKSLVVPSTMPVGDYELLLSLPERASSLRNRPEYAIQMANVGLWEPLTGYNNLQQMITVK